MKIEVATADDIRSVALNMRDADLAEFLALTPAADRADLAELLTQRYAGRDEILCAFHDNTPVAIGGLIEARPNVITLMFFATPDLRLIGGALTRFIKQRLLPPLVAAGVHRIECVSLVGHDEAHKWIHALGLSQEAYCLNYGRDKQAFIQFSWISDVHPARA